jgi:hypothetical protein
MRENPLEARLEQFPKGVLKGAGGGAARARQDWQENALTL